MCWVFEADKLSNVWRVALEKVFGKQVGHIFQLCGVALDDRYQIEMGPDKGYVSDPMIVVSSSRLCFSGPESNSTCSDLGYIIATHNSDHLMSKVDVSFIICSVPR